MSLWTSPNFPVGAFAYSHGLEWAVECGAVANFSTASDWIDGLLRHGAPRNDLVLAGECWRAAHRGDPGAIEETNALALALAGGRERYLETSAQGAAFLIAVRASWPNALLDLAPTGDIAYPIAFALAAAGHGVGLEMALEGFCLGFLGNLTSAAVRLGVIGQTQGQQLLARFAPRAALMAQACALMTLDDLGGFAYVSDIAAMRHETQYSRLFRS